MKPPFIICVGEGMGHESGRGWAATYLLPLTGHPPRACDVFVADSPERLLLLTRGINEGTVILLWPVSEDEESLRGWMGERGLEVVTITDLRWHGAIREAAREVQAYIWFGRSVLEQFLLRFS